MKQEKQDFQILLQKFFTVQLYKEKQVSSHTIVSYRDTFKLLLDFVHQKYKLKPEGICLIDLDVECIRHFLNYLEEERKASARSRNQRLAALRSFYKFVSFERPDLSGSIQRILSIPCKRYTRRNICFLQPDEVSALQSGPDLSQWVGRRDQAILILAIQTGLRVSEITSLKVEDVILSNGPYVKCQGKGRKERCTPLTKNTTRILRSWLKERPVDSEYFFTTSLGKKLSSDAIQARVKIYAQKAAQKCPSIAKKRITPHVLRHTAAMQLLQSGVDRSIISLWLGHESYETTQMYLSADLKIKEKIIEKVKYVNGRNTRFKPTNDIFLFLKTL